jgi:hypothetical protein
MAVYIKGCLDAVWGMVRLQEEQGISCPEALEHLDFAIKEFREMKMQPSLERALRHKDILKA